MAQLLSGDEAVAAAAFDAGIKLGTGYPGTPSTEILEALDALGGRAQWAPNEKVALEVGLGVALAGQRSVVTMKHVGLNVAADPLFTAAYMNVDGALVIVSADDPGMASSQNEQDNRRFAVAAAVPMLEPADSQEAYEFTLRAMEISERWHVPVLLRLTTRVCHSKTRLRKEGIALPPPPPGAYRRDVHTRSMVPSNARPAHRRLRGKLDEIAAWGETAGLHRVFEGSAELGIVTSGISYQHVREAAPEASVLKLGLTHPLPLETIRAFAAAHARCLVVEEGDPYLVETLRTHGIAVEDKLPLFRFGELNVERVRRLIARDATPEAAPPPGKPPELCPGCPHRYAYTALKKLGAIVSGDIGCYGLGVMEPFDAVDTSVCMGASVGVGLGLRHAMPAEQAKRVVSVLGDSTFMHTGINGVIEMVYNPPPTGHILLVLDNGTTAMTGLQEHPGTGRTLNHDPTGKVGIEALCRAAGVTNVHVTDATSDLAGFEACLQKAMDTPELTVIVNRRPCVLAARAIREYEKCHEEQSGR